MGSRLRCDRAICARNDAEPMFNIGGAVSINLRNGAAL